MIPGASILLCSPGIGEAISRGNRALGDTIDSIHGHVEQLSNPMPVDASSVRVELIVDGNRNSLLVLLGYHKTYRS